MPNSYAKKIKMSKGYIFNVVPFHVLKELIKLTYSEKLKFLELFML